MAREKLSKTEIELLTDYIVDHTNDPRIALAFLVLMDEIDHLSEKRPMDLDSICLFAMERAYYRLCYTRNCKGNQPKLTAELRRKFKWKGKL